MFYDEKAVIIINLKDQKTQVYLDLVNVNLAILSLQLLIRSLHSIHSRHCVS